MTNNQSVGASNRKMLPRQLALLAAIVIFFAVFDLGIWFTFTRRCLPDGGEVPQARVIDIDSYLPFRDDSKIVRTHATLPFEGELPVIDGAEGLYPVFSAVVNAIYPEDAVSYDGENFTSDSRLQMNNTLRAYRAVVDGTSDIVFCARASSSQLAYAEEKGVELEFVPIGREAFVFLVNIDNPVDSLTVEQMRGIYGGTYTSWSQLGGRALPINALTRLSGSGSQTALLAFLGDTPIIHSPFGFVGSPIGFSFRFYAADAIANGGVKMLALNGVYPDRQSIADGSYPAVSDFYAVYDRANDNANVRIIIDWLLSDEGQYIISETGYSPLK